MAGLERAITNVSACLHVSAEVSWREAMTDASICLHAMSFLLLGWFCEQCEGRVGTGTPVLIVNRGVRASCATDPIDNKSCSRSQGPSPACITGKGPISDGVTSAKIMQISFA